MRSARIEDVASLRHRLLDCHLKMGVALQARDKAAALGVERGPPGEVVVSQIKDIGHARFDGHRLGLGDVVGPLACEGRRERGVNTGIEDDVQLDGAGPL